MLSADNTGARRGTHEHNDPPGCALRALLRVFTAASRVQAGRASSVPTQRDRSHGTGVDRHSLQLR
jgi:hypothetical protein